MKIEELSSRELLDELCSANNKYVVGIEASPEYIETSSRLEAGDKAIKAIVNKDIRTMADICADYLKKVRNESR